jgi:hypothetical protein
VKPSWSTGEAEWTTKFSYKGPVPTLQLAFDDENGDPGPWFEPELCKYSGDELIVISDDPAYPYFQNGNFACLRDKPVIDRQNKTIEATAYILGDMFYR